MQTQSSFDLNRAIQHWRENLAQSPAFRRENLNELESHLRDAIRDLQERELSAREAFLVAATRMGDGERVAAEYGKVNGAAIWRDRLVWMLIGWQVWTLISSIVGLVSRNALWFGFLSVGYDVKLYGNGIPMFVFAAVQVAAFAASLTLCGWLFLRKGHALAEWLAKALCRRTSFVLAFVICCAVLLSVPLVSSAMTTLLFHTVDPRKIGDLTYSLNVSIIVSSAVRNVVLVGLTFVLARKRLRPAGNC